MATEEKKEDKLEIGGLMKMSTLKKLLKAGVLVVVGVIIGRKTA